MALLYTFAMFSGFYCSMETSRRIRVGTRNQRDRNCLGFDVGVENGLVLVFGSKLTWF